MGWTEKYLPKCCEDVVGQENRLALIKEFVLTSEELQGFLSQLIPSQETIVIQLIFHNVLFSAMLA